MGAKRLESELRWINLSPSCEKIPPFPIPEFSDKPLCTSQGSTNLKKLKELNTLDLLEEGKKLIDQITKSVYLGNFL